MKSKTNRYEISVKIGNENRYKKLIKKINKENTTKLNER